MSYYIDMKTMTLDDCRELIRRSDLVKSRLMLQENLDERFDALQQYGFANTEELFNLLKNKKKLQDLSEESGMDENYLVLLIRELKGYRQPPVKIADFPDLSETAVKELLNLGIKNTQQLYDQIAETEGREELKTSTGFDDNLILYLARMTDLCRIRWVNHTFAYMLIETGFLNASDVKNADPEDMHGKINAINKERGFYKGQIGLHDMKLVIEAAQLLPEGVHFE